VDQHQLQRRGSCGGGGNLIRATHPVTYESQAGGGGGTLQVKKQWETELDLILPAGEVSSWTQNRQPVMMSISSNNQPQVGVSPFPFD